MKRSNLFYRQSTTYIWRAGKIGCCSLLLLNFKMATCVSQASLSLTKQTDTIYKITTIQRLSDNIPFFSEKSYLKSKVKITRRLIKLDFDIF